MGPDNNTIILVNRGFIIWPPFTIPVFIVIEFRFTKLVLVLLSLLPSRFSDAQYSILGTCSTWGSVAEDSAGNLPLSPITNYLAGFRGSIFFLCRGPS